MNRTVATCASEDASMDTIISTEVLTLTKYVKLLLRVHTLQQKRICKSFCRRYRHKNLIEFMGFCCSPPAIVFELMERGSLADNLHVRLLINNHVVYFMFEVIQIYYI